MKMYARYMLRRVLLIHNARAVIRETVAFCRRNHIDEIAWIDESPGFYHELLTIPEVRERAHLLAEARDASGKAGIAYSINVVTTIGHGDYSGRVRERLPGLDYMVGPTGAESLSCVCSFSPVWQDHIRETYRVYAATNPVRIWVDDDFRNTGHGAARFACYCPRHLEEFSRRIGREVSRQELVTAILRPGAPHSWRPVWLALQEESLCRAAEMLREAVHSVSPNTQLGWMSTTPFIHELEGRGHRAQLKAFAGVGTAAVRLCSTRYHEGNPRTLLISDEALKKALPELPEGTTRCTEIESMPHSLYNMSAAWIEAMITWPNILGVPNQTLNVFDYIGTPMERTPNVGAMLRTVKSRLQAITEVFGEGRFRGVGILSHPYSASFVHTMRGRDFQELQARESGWTDVLRGFGVPVLCSSGEEITAVTGQAFRCFDKKKIREVLTRGVLLDLSALKVLHELGLGGLAGVKVTGEISQRHSWTGSEQLVDPAFGGGKHHCTWIYGVPADGRIAIFETAPNARVISRIVDPDNRPVLDAVVLYENELGGRAAVYPYDFSGVDPDIYIKGATSSFYSEYRREQVQGIIRWLARGRVPLMIRANGWILPHRADGPDRIALAAMNINYDAWPLLKMECAVEQSIKSLKVLSPDGRWHALSRRSWAHRKGMLRVCLHGPVPPLKTVCVLVDLEDKR